MGVDLLAEQRRLIEEALRRMGGFYDNNADAQTLMQRTMGQVTGQDVPFTQTVLNNMLGQNADSANGQFQQQRRIIDRGFANAGLTGSGLQSSALADAAANAARAARAGRRDITTRAELENYNARITAQQMAQSFLQQREDVARNAAEKEIAYRAQMHATGSEGDVANVTGGTPANTGQTAPAPVQAAPRPKAPPAWFGYWAPPDANAPQYKFMGNGLTTGVTTAQGGTKFANDYATWQKGYEDAKQRWILTNGGAGY